MSTPEPRERVGLVLAGAGARGAYEAGALSILLPKLEAEGRRPTVIVGTSAGAINAAFLASRANVSARTATKELVKLWKEIDRSAVMGSLLANLFAATTYAGASALDVGHRGRGVLDTSPLGRTLGTAMGKWEWIAKNVSTRRLDAVGLVATAAATGEAVVFCATHLDLPDHDEVKGIHYTAPEEGLGVDHVLASAAIPVLFPPVELEFEDDKRWFMDGGTRLNTPIKPALKFGVDRVVIVSTDPSSRAPHTLDAADTDPPRIDDAMLHLIKAGLADPLVEDMHTLARINDLVKRRKPAAGSKRLCPYLFVGPEEPGLFADLARSALAESQSAPWLREIEHKALHRILEHRGRNSAELASYVMFEPRFIDKCIAAGRADANRALAEATNGAASWQIGPPPRRRPAMV